MTELADGPGDNLKNLAKKVEAKFGSDLRAVNLKRDLKTLDTKWSKLSDDERKGVAETVGVVSSNIEKFAQARENPIGAIQGAVEILASIASNFGPKGQMVSMALGFVSSILSLFGKGPQPVPIDEVLRREINEALDNYHDRELRSEAGALLRSLAESKAYLDNFAEGGRQMNIDQVTLASTRVPITQGSRFTGRLMHEISGMLDGNNAEDGRKCITYIELYVQLITMRDLILTQYIAMSSDDEELTGDIRGLIGIRDMIRQGAQVILEKLYTVKFNSKILPYFDPDESVITHSVAKAMFGLGNFGLHQTLKTFLDLGEYVCLQYLTDKTEDDQSVEDRWMDLSWSEDKFQLEGNKPYTYLTDKNRENCFWKLVPHGRETFSIVNKYKCDVGDSYCNAMLSIVEDGDKTYVTVDHDVPVLWRMEGCHYRM